MNGSESVRTVLGLPLALILFAAAHVNAQNLPKAGKYSSHYAWIFQGTTQELGPNRSVTVGSLPGVNFNDQGSGFLHNSRTDCTIISEINSGRAEGRGSCVVTDGAGDQAFLMWRCGGQLGAQCDGDFQWVGGTGKYTGLSGNNRFQAFFIGGTGAGYSLWNGEWRLP